MMELDKDHLANAAARQSAPCPPAPVPAPADHALAACANGVLILDAALPGLPILYANPAFCRMGGFALSDLLGQGCTQLLRDERGALGLPALLAEVLASGSAHSMELHHHRKDGGRFWSALTVSPALGDGGALTHLVCVVEDIGALRQHQALLSHLAAHDEMTGLPNRSQFSERLQHAMAQAGRRCDAVALVCLSVDSYPLVNESLGHVAADQFLLGVAQRLKTCLRSQDVLTRHGGNEFVIILCEIVSQDQVIAVCEDLLRGLAPPFPVNGQDLHARVSMGIARYPQDGGDAVTLLRYADMALAGARAEGGKGYRFFTADMNQRSLERVQMEAALRTALAQDQFQLMYQPMADLRDGAICALEVLVRWQHPSMGQISARRFIPMAEEAGLTGAIGHWILQRAIDDMRAWREAGLAPVRVAVNISPKQFRDPGLPEHLAGLLQQSNIAPEQLSLEITEAALVHDINASAHTLSLLKALGIGLALDDFGTGYSSLNHLKHFPFDLLKIDCDLIGNIITGTDDAAMVTTIIAMAHHLGIAVSAEGVETEAQCDFLRRNMCDQIQGYFFGAPVDAAEIAALVEKRHALPAHLLRIQKQKRTLLLVDDEQNIVSALKRLLRRDDYQILSANSGQEGLDVLAVNAVDVIVSDQRMPGMLGADFLRAAKGLYPDTLRIMLSGYTELQSVTDAVNEGAIYKFLTKPWDDEQLRAHIAEAFHLKEIADENERLNLELRTANHELAAANRKMEELLRQKQQQITRSEASLNVARELLQYVPLAVVGLDEDGMVAFVNAAADDLFRERGPLLGDEALAVLPELFPDAPAGRRHALHIGGQLHEVVAHPMGVNSQSRGSLITLCRIEERHGHA